MKILHVISSMDPKAGGVSQGIRNLNPYIVKGDVQVEVISIDDKNEDYQLKDEFVIHKIGKGKTSFQYNPKLYVWLMQNLENYDCVVVHGIWQYHNYAVYIAIKKLKKKAKKTPKVIIMVHGMLDPYFQKAADRKMKALRNELVWRCTEKKAINAADALFFTCEEELLLARTTFKGYLPKKEINVGFGIQKPPIFEVQMKKAFEQKCPEILGKKYWLFISRIHPKKGVDVLIDAYNKMTSANHILPDLVIVGPVDSDYAQQMIEKANVNPQIHFLGMLTGNSKWGAFYGCEAYLLPSHQENFGIAIVEAMACKKPVLITKNINIWREIEAGNGGWILEEVSTDSIEKSLLVISKYTDAHLENKGKCAIETFNKTFDVEDCADIFITTLKNL
ncbi:glycosyltransferase [Flavobacterium limnophilum]|uniref:glycosyltransferase n=1 Tax=Flavobacterium limnophilum TaxID=3003262 RepID=UPI00248268AB|nr:glycosyltransferase [Flavobacterium limnophilum]